MWELPRKNEALRNARMAVASIVGLRTSVENSVWLSSSTGQAVQLFGQYKLFLLPRSNRVQQ